MQQRFAEVEEAVRLEEEIIVIRVIPIPIISIIIISISIIIMSISISIISISIISIIRLKEERGGEGEKEQLKVSKFIMICGTNRAPQRHDMKMCFKR